MDISELIRADKDNINRHPWEIARSKIVYEILSKQHRHFNAIADIGSGDMYLLHELEKKEVASGYFAVDNSYTENLVMELKDMHSPSSIVACTSAQQIVGQKPESIPDCFLFLDVLEHCHNDTAMLYSTIAGTLHKKKSITLITVPAFQYLFSNHDRLLSHHRRYTLSDLEKKCELSGLQVVNKGYFFFSLFLVRHVYVYLEKIGLLKTKSSLEAWNKGKFITQIVVKLLLLDFRITNLMKSFGIKMPGLSCYCMCHTE